VELAQLVKSTPASADTLLLLQQQHDGSHVQKNYSPLTKNGKKRSSKRLRTQIQQVLAKHMEAYVPQEFHAHKTAVGNIKALWVTGAQGHRGHRYQ
jgi:hypothetical protein